MLRSRIGLLLATAAVGVVGALGLAACGPADASTAAASLSRAVDLQMRIVTDLLDYARGSRGKLSIHPVRVALRSPMDAEGSIPMEPASTAPSSLKISPNMFVVTTTSNCFGLRINCMAQLSTSMCSSWTPA